MVAKDNRLEVVVDITKIPDEKLQKDLEDSRGDVSVCKIALYNGVKFYSGGSVQSRLEVNEKIIVKIEAEQKRRKDVYTSNGTYKKGTDPETTCWHCKQTFLCDCMDATCRICGAPYDKSSCKEFNFKPEEVIGG